MVDPRLRVNTLRRFIGKTVNVRYKDGSILTRVKLLEVIIRERKWNESPDRHLINRHSRKHKRFIVCEGMQEGIRKIPIDKLEDVEVLDVVPY